MAPVVVFDTNIFFSAIGWQGRPFACLERARLGAADGVTSQAILNIVTGDRRHLLPLGSFRGITIISAADFLALVPEP